MKTSTFFLKNMLCFAIAISTLSISAQTYITIDNTVQSNTEWTTLQEAIDAAAPIVDPAGVIIYIQPSPTSYGVGTIQDINSALTIVGRSHSETSNVSTVSTINIYSSNVTIKGVNTGGITIRDNVSGGLEADIIKNVKVFECKTGNITVGYVNTTYGADGVEIQGCIMSSLTQYKFSKNILVTNNIITSSLNIASPTTLLLTKNIFRGTSSFSISNSAPGETLILHDNMFISNYFNDTLIYLSNYDFNINYCLTYNYGAGDVIFTPSGSTLTVNNTDENTNPLFTNVDPSVTFSFASPNGYNPATRLEDNLTLQAGSPALTRGGGGSELGVFANGFNYKNLGNPRGIPVMDILSWDGAAPAGGSITVDISAKAH